MKILIVEDEPAIADTLVYALGTEGFATQWVTTGAAALNELADSTYDLLLLDIGLPDMSGFDVCKQIRADSSMPIIFLTSRIDDIDQVLGLELGADDYVTKPFSPRVLTARIRSRLKNRMPGQPVQEQGFAIDAEGYRVLLHGSDLHLSRYEFRILQTLLAHPGRVYSRSQLMDIAWDEPERSFDRTVDTHIKTIRQKIRELDQRLDVIKTHRGLGYSFQP
jgi:two-component system catabolic regulation response regulator CreB